LLFDSSAAVINADEAYTRIETFEILRGQFPIALGGTVYTLPFEAYLYTPFTSPCSTARTSSRSSCSATLSWLAALAAIAHCTWSSDGGCADPPGAARAGLIAASLCWVTPVLSDGAVDRTPTRAYASGMFVIATRLLAGAAHRHRRC
jgi:hypothetical protein